MVDEDMARIDPIVLGFSQEADKAHGKPPLSKPPIKPCFLVKERVHR